MNRATARESIFAGEGDYAAFERVLAEARQREAEFMRIFSYVLMPNHFHLVLWPFPGEDEAVSRLMKWLTLTHAQRWHAHRRTAGTGSLYGARFKSFPVREDWHFLKVCRYVERNPLRANLVERAELWPWCSLNKRLAASEAEPTAVASNVEGPVPPGAAELLDEWPTPEPPDWLERVNQADTPAELEALRRCVRRGRPYGDDAWVMRTAERLGLAASLRPGGPAAEEGQATLKLIGFRPSFLAPGRPSFLAVNIHNNFRDYIAATTTAPDPWGLWSTVSAIAEGQ